MRVLVVDQDSTLLTEISQLLGEYFSIDAVRTKADCLDLVRSNPFEVIVACERLEDGSGLELLGHLARSHPDMLRIFAAERERLQLLKGRLAPFGLFRTLAYPIEPRQLLAALSAAAGVEEEVEETETEAKATPPTQARAVSQPRARPAQPAPTIAPAAAAQPRPQAATRTPTPARSPAYSGRPGQAHGYRPSGPRQPTAAALAAASRLEIVQRPKGYPLPAHSSPTRSAVLVAAGVVVVLAGLWLSLKIFNTRATPVATQLATTRSQGYPPEVIKLVADTETAFGQDNLKAARTDVAALQQIAPDHPRLPFFVSLLQKLEANSHESTSHRLFQRHTSPPEHTPSTPAVAENDAKPVRQRPGAVSPASQSTSLPPGATLPSATDAPTREAQLIQRVPPDYPPDAERRGIEGAVDVSFTVDPDGKVTDVIVIHSEPSDIFDRAAATAVRRWRYEPKLMSGTPVEEHMQVRVEFKLDSASGH